MRCQDKMVLLRTLIERLQKGLKHRAGSHLLGHKKNQTPKELDSNRRRSESGDGNHIIYLRNSPRSFWYTSPVRPPKPPVPAPVGITGFDVLFQFVKHLTNCVSRSGSEYFYTPAHLEFSGQISRRAGLREKPQNWKGDWTSVRDIPPLRTACTSQRVTKPGLQKYSRGYKLGVSRPMLLLLGNDLSLSPGSTFRKIQINKILKTISPQALG